MILYHGTSKRNAQIIDKEGFVPDKKYNWKVKSKKGFVYLSLAYAPFYAMQATKGKNDAALIKVVVNENNLYPEDDFIMNALGFPVYTQKQLSKIDLEKYKSFYKESLQYLGNACTNSKYISIVGIQYFNTSKLIYVCDPSITQINYRIMGEYYRKLTDWIFEGNKPEEFRLNLWLKS